MTTQTIKLPNKVIDSDWKDDVDFEPFKDEKTYISPSDVKKETINRIKQSPIKLSINGLWHWEKEDKRLAA